MASRKIVIEGCGVCPHRDHRGAFGAVGYIPKCGKMNRDLPFTAVTQECQGRKGHYNTVAVGTGVIPDWCPLEKN